MRLREALASWVDIEPGVTIPCAAASAVALVVSLGGWTREALPIDVAWVAVVLCGVPIVVGAVRGLVVERDVTADVLVSLALIASLVAGEWFAAGEVALIMQVGSMLEDHTSERARKGIEALVRMTPQTARVLREGRQVTVAAEEVAVGDEVLVLAGETVPVDGVVVEGQTSVDQSVMTGESIPVDKGAGDEVTSGVVNQLGPFTLRATRVCQDSALARMVHLAREADASKAPVVSLADRWAAWLVGVALACALGAWALTGEFIRAVTVLVVFCPCAFVLATPTAVSAGIANATAHGVLVRSGGALERLARVRCVALDKTGTLTMGRPRVVAVAAVAAMAGAPAANASDLSFGETGVLRLAAALEQRSEHPLGKAVVASWEERASDADALPMPEPTGLEVLPGRGIAGVVEGVAVLAGTAALLAERGVATAKVTAFADSWTRKGAALILVAADGVCVGALALADELRPKAACAMEQLREQGVEPVLLTGDSAAAASGVAEAVGITDVRAHLLPEDKLANIRQLVAGGRQVCMVGDGVNDALALRSASAGIAMGGIGSDVAVESADAVLVSDDLTRVPYILGLSSATMRKVRQNIALGLVINLVAVCLSVSGALTPVTAALFHNCGSVFVVINAATLLRRRAERR